MLGPLKIGLFDVGLLYNVFVPHDSDPFPWRSIWRNKVPSRVVFFVWLAALGKILTLDNLRKYVLTSDLTHKKKDNTIS